MLKPLISSKLFGRFTQLFIHLIWDDNLQSVNSSGAGSTTQKMIDAFVLFHFVLNSEVSETGV